MDLNSQSESLENDHQNQLADVVSQATQSIQQKDNAILALKNQLVNVSNQSQAQNKLITSMDQAGVQLQQQLGQQGQLINSMGQAGAQLEGKLNEQQQRYHHLGQFTQHVLNMGKSMEQFYSNILQTNQVQYNEALNSIQHELYETKQIQWDQMNQNQQRLIENLHNQTSQHNTQQQLLLTDESNHRLVNHKALEVISHNLQEIRTTGRENLSNHQKEMLRTLFNMYRQFSTPKITGKNKPLAIKHKKGDHEKPSPETRNDKKRGKNLSRALIPTGSTRS
jgi:hypothetical protein